MQQQFLKTSVFKNICKASSAFLPLLSAYPFFHHSYERKSYFGALYEIPSQAGDDVSGLQKLGMTVGELIKMTVGGAEDNKRKNRHSRPNAHPVILSIFSTRHPSVSEGSLQISPYRKILHYASLVQNDKRYSHPEP